MDELIKKMYKSEIVSSLVLILLGILLIFKSETTIITISYVIGAIIIATGVIAFINYFTNKALNTGLNIVYGSITVITGILIITNPTAIASFIPIVIGIGIIINSAIKLQYALDLRKFQNRLWKSTLVISIVCAICGVVILFNPFEGAVVITKIIGIFIVFYAVIDLIAAYTIKKSINEVKEGISAPVYDAEVVKEKKSKRKSKNKREK